MIRKMNEADIEVVTALERELFIHPWKDDQFHYECFENAYANLFVYEEDGMVLGYLDYWITFETAQVAKIAVAKHVQRNGIAQKLLHHCITACELAMCESITLEVRENNTAAIHLYEKNGFMEVTKRKGYYSNGEDAYLMIKVLGGNYQ